MPRCGTACLISLLLGCAAACRTPPPRLALAATATPADLVDVHSPRRVELARRMQAALSDVERVLAAVCRDRCGRVSLEETDWGAAHMQPAPGAGPSTIRYSPHHYSERKAGAAELFYVMGHEYGHHLDLLDGSSPARSIEPALWRAGVALDRELGRPGRVESFNRELRADAIAGCALKRAHVPIEVVAERLARSFGELDRQSQAAQELEGLDAEHPHVRFTVRAMRDGASICARRAPRLEELLLVGDAATTRAIRAALRRRDEQRATAR